MLDFAHEARFFSRLTAQTGSRGSCVSAPAISRADRLIQIKEQIANGSYLTDGRLDAALEQMLSAQCR